MFLGNLPKEPFSNELSNYSTITFSNELSNYSTITLTTIMSSSTKKCEESCCLCSCTLHGRHHFHTGRFTTGMLRFEIIILILRRLHKSNVWTCELSIKRSKKKKDNSEVYRLRWQAQKTFAVFHLVPLCFWKSSSYWLTACGWLLSGGWVVLYQCQETNPTVHLFKTNNCHI